jgi:phage terminase small subunit
MPRKSVEALRLQSFSASARRVKAPADLPPEIRAIWGELVDALPPDRFHSSDRPLLALYCRALHQASLAFAKLEEHGAAYETSISPWQKVADTNSKIAASLAVRLRLCPQSRLDRKVAGPAARQLPETKPWDRTLGGEEEDEPENSQNA